MEALFLNPVSIVPKHGVGCGCFLAQIKRNVICCHNGGNGIKNCGFATERSSTVINADHSAALVDTTAGMLSTEGNSTRAVTNQAKGLVPFNGTSTSWVESPDTGIGITNFLGGKTFFITGATGFLGKILIEKILRTVPDVHRIYILVRAKNKEVAMERVENDMINAGLFECLKQIYGKSYRAFMLSKIVPVVGNVSEASLGLDEDVANRIVKEVDVIVNSAANTSFDERYDVALDINTGGPGRLISFARKCHNVKLFVQISTAYVNGKRQGIIMEKPFYFGESIAGETLLHGAEPTLDVEGEIRLGSESKQDLEGHVLSKRMKELGLERANKYGWQDTYVFTKAMGEMMIDNLRGDMPVVVIRPSVIESTYSEPFPGWIEGIRMMDPIILYYGKGLLTGFLADSNVVLDVIPADMVVNATIAAIAKHGAAGKSKTNIYQIASSVVNPLVMEDLFRLFFEHFSSSPCLDSKGGPIHIPRMKLFSSMEDFSSHLWQDAMDRSGSRAMAHPNGKISKKLESICRKSMGQAKYLANLYEPYTFYGGRFDNSNTRTLMEGMSMEERRQFGFDIESIDWKDYIKKVHIPGLRMHVMKGRIGRS